MHRLLWSLGITALCLLGGVGVAYAHHTGGHGGGGANYFNPFSTQSRPPRTFLSFNFAVDVLDEDLGEVLRYQLSGEYAVTRRFSVGARLPFFTIREKFLPPSDGIGDVGLTFKGLLWRRPEAQMNLTLGSSFSFPTGNESKGLGEGEVLLSPFLNYAWVIGSVDFYTTLGMTVSAASQVSPALDYSAGANIPLIPDGTVPLHFFVALQGSTSFTSEVFTDGATKVYLTPGFILYLKKNLITTFGSRISVLDTLKVKPGTTLTQAAPFLLSDVLAGFNFNVDYFF